ncbi:hypothetical protein [Dyella sp. 20L07]|uniref:hypothetical protein n=1 Tax=Dyella sp. 20L07 TaxID=3384240 RepID=UPI003D279449
MTDDLSDDLLVLYRQAARERTSMRMDRMILAEAERTTRWRRVRSRHFRTAAIAASVAALALAIHGFAQHSEPMLPASSIPDLTDGSTSAYLQRMDISPQASATQQYLMVETTPIY